MEDPGPDTPTELTEAQALVAEELEGMARAVARMEWNRRRFLDLDELTAVALAALVAQCRKWSWERAETFQSAAISRVRGAVLDHLRAQDLASRGSREVATRISRLPGSERMTTEQIARALEVSVDTVERAVRATERSLVPLSPVHQTVVAPNGDAEETALSLQIARGTSDLISTMDETSQAVLVCVYVNGMQIKETAQALGLTVPRTTKVHVAAVRRVLDHTRRIHEAVRNS